MIDNELLNRLSVLARVRVPVDQIQDRLQDFQGILKCIDELSNIAIPSDFRMQYAVVNHARLDIVIPAVPDTVARIQQAFPDRQMDYLKVPQVLKKN